MKQQPVTLAIPTPCHEDWQKMTPAEQGRFCASCQKTVMDFTHKTDREVARFFEQGSNNTCGRFRPDQLQRPLHAVQPNGFGMRLRALGVMVPGLLLGGWAEAQNSKHIVGKVSCPRPTTTNVLPQIVGDVAVVPVEPKALIGDTVVVEDTNRTINGKVTDKETGEPIAFSTVRINGTSIETDTDIDGNYALQVPESIVQTTLSFHATGYAVQEFVVAPGQQVVNQALYYGIDIGLVGEIVIVRKDQTLYNILRHKARRFMQHLMGNIAERRAERAIAKQKTTPLPEAPMGISVMPTPDQPTSPTPHEAMAVEAFPNPFYNNLNLRFDSPVAERLTFRLVDMKGQTLFLQKYEAMKGLQVLVLEPLGADLPSGQYLLEVSNGEVLRFAGMVVKGRA